MSDDDDDGIDEIRSLLADGRKIDAIKAYRERTGADLAAAKAAVEAIADENPASLDDAASGLNADSEKQIVSRMENQGKIAAIKLYRELTQASLVDAKRAVEALAAKHGIEPQSAGCFGVITFLAIAFAGGASVLLWAA